MPLIFWKILAPICRVPRFLFLILTQTGIQLFISAEYTLMPDNSQYRFYFEFKEVPRKADFIIFFGALDAASSSFRRGGGWA